MGRARVFFAGRDEPDEISGADVVVVQASDGEQWAPTICIRAPNSVVVVVGGSPQPICETTLFPRARVLGVADQQTADAVVQAIANDLDQQFDAVVRCEGERGIEGEFAEVPVRIGAGGIREIIEN